MITEPSSPPGFDGSIQRIPPDLRQLMIEHKLWHQGCPVPIGKLRLLTLNYFDFDGTVHEGSLVVHRKVSNDVLDVFGKLYADQFPMERVQAVRGYGSDTSDYDRFDVTSGFDCRDVTGSGNEWSQHAFGLAVDVNPVQNPYVKGHHVRPKEGRHYKNRAQNKPGMIHEGDVVESGFRHIGWGWGGNWNTLKDYMHFSRKGR